MKLDKQRRPQTVFHISKRAIKGRENTQGESETTPANGYKLSTEAPTLSTHPKNFILHLNELVLVFHFTATTVCLCVALLQNTILLHSDQLIWVSAVVVSLPFWHCYCILCFAACCHSCDISWSTLCLFPTAFTVLCGSTYLIMWGTKASIQRCEGWERNVRCYCPCGNSL